MLRAGSMRWFFEWIHALPCRVATKFAVIFTGGSLIALAVVTTALALHERRAVSAAAAVDLKAEGEALAPILADVWRREGEARALELLRVAGASKREVSLAIIDDGAAPPPGGPDRAVVVVPIHAPHSLVLEKATPSVESAMAEALAAFVYAGIFLTLFAALATYAVGEWLLGGPLRRVAARARRIGEGDLGEPLRVRGSTEIAALEEAINRMSGDLREARARARAEEERRVEAVNRLRHADRLTTVGTLAAGIAHELGTPLNVILLEAKSLARSPSDERRVRDGGHLIRDQAARMVTIVRQLLDFARRKTPTRTLEDAVRIVSSTAALVSSLARSRGCVIETSLPKGPVHFLSDPTGVQQILTNLFVNAFDAMPDGGRVMARVTRVRRPEPGHERERDWICFEVEDEGIGMDEDMSRRVFEPFFTTKDVGSGTGLGLSVALGIARDHGGFIEVRQRSPRGSVFAVFFPDAEDDVNAAPSAGSARIGSPEPSSSPVPATPFASASYLAHGGR